MLYEIRNVLRLEGYEVDKHTNRRVICHLLDLKKDSTLFSICEKLNMSYIGREVNQDYNNSIKIYIHFLDKETTLSFESLSEMSKKLGINVISCKDEREKVLEKTILVNGEKAVLSYNNKIDRNFDFPPCLENKTNINLALSSKLGYTVDFEISIPEIFSLLQEKIPNHRVKERLCQLLRIPYYFERREGFNQKRRKVLARAQEEILIFESLNSAGNFFQTSGTMIRKMINLNYRIPLWFKRYTLEFV